MRKKILEGRNLDEVKIEATKIFRQPVEELNFNILKKKKGILGIGAEVTVEVVLDKNPFEEGLTYLKSVIKSMEIEANIEMFVSNNEVKYNIYSNHNPILIGREGKNLDSLQYLTKQVMVKYTDERLICLVDVGGYKQKRKTQLEILATKTAKEVARSKVEVRLDPMNAYERRIIHTKLSEWRDIYTESVGENEHRCLVIKPKVKR